MLEKSSLNAMHILNLLPCQQPRQERATTIFGILNESLLFKCNLKNVIKQINCARLKEVEMRHVVNLLQF